VISRKVEIFSECRGCWNLWQQQQLTSGRSVSPYAVSVQKVAWLMPQSNNAVGLIL